MAERKVIVFGPTGAVGSNAARTAAALGAKVVLAMRDTAKAIPGLSSEEEKRGGFERVYADLGKPDTVRDAVTKTGAKSAFFYLAWGSGDHMKATIQALKSAGIVDPVFLSSYTVPADRKAAQPSELTPYGHAQVELSLIDVYGAEGFIAVRPGSFASNTQQYKSGLQKGLVKVLLPTAKVDNIVPADIGRTAGTALVKGPLGGDRILPLYGPELLSGTETVNAIAEVLGKSVKTEKATEEEAYKMYTEEQGFPAPVAKYIVGFSKKDFSGEDQVLGTPVSKAELNNVERYTGTKGTTFKEWVQLNKNLFTE